MPNWDQFEPMPPLVPGKYRHYKGGEYEVLTLACNEATHEWMVIYKALYDTGTNPSVWARTFADFTSAVETDAGIQSRFVKIND